APQGKVLTTAEAIAAELAAAQAARPAVVVAALAAPPAGAWMLMLGLSPLAGALVAAGLAGAACLTGATVTGVAAAFSSRLRKNLPLELPLELNTMALIGWPLA
ncbi:MAG: hypothetical protein EB126_07170, partial [Synechococcaceae bacterium WBB_10_009]|nr:hypothetical protein [Synechococcaceae bacterium WBB_10_009]